MKMVWRDYDKSMMRVQRKQGESIDKVLVKKKDEDKAE